MERIFHCFLLIHLFFSVIPECATASIVISSVPVYVTSKVDWWFALKHCRTHYSDLITIRNETESEELGGYKGWIGLHRQASDGVWKWSGGDENASNIIWANGEPHSGEDCVYKSYIRLKSGNCSHLKYMLCTEENLILVQEMKTWEEAYEHCEELSAEGSMRKYTLPNSFASPASNRKKIRESTTTNEVWIGLRFLADKWFWLNGKPVSISHLPNCPPPMQHCGALDTNDNKVKIMDCSEKRNFLCSMKP
ncbi:secretory phospholipase A2 receptor-like [Scomber scombrus]|uniref:Secretory phospholipase A2 receptor-like n=1 Tax=Scomber scombrus TaxID=13677 RepID=A0AAV1P8W6_SCOSC